jgi:20S proteasome alpha/beta subunit
VDSSERVAAVCAGKGEHLIQPILDEITHMEEDNSLWELSSEGENAFFSCGTASFKQARAIYDKIHGDASGNQLIDMSGETNDAQILRHCVDLSEKEACDVVMRAFHAAAEREISIGDGVEIWIVRKGNKRMNGIAGGKKAMHKREMKADSVKRLYFSLPAH